LWFVRRDVLHYLTLDASRYTPCYWGRRYGLLLHVCSGTLALTVGLVQVYLGLTGRTRRAHRWLGRVYLAGVTGGVCAALYLAATIPPPAAVYALGLLGLAIAWVVTTGKAYLAVRRGDINAHRAWMIRSYVVTFGFVTFRVVQALLARSGITGDDASFDIAAWACWTVPLLLVEPAIRRGLAAPAVAAA
jgi:uncharacterized membrane protein